MIGVGQQLRVHGACDGMHRSWTRHACAELLFPLISQVYDKVAYNSTAI